MDASSRFNYEIAPKLGLRDVFKMKLDYTVKQFEMSDFTFDLNGNIKVEKKPEYEMPSQDEIDEYIRARDEYVATEVLRKCGWTEFVKRCELAGIEDYINEHTPCDGQCNMFCPRCCWNIS